MLNICKVFFSILASCQITISCEPDVEGLGGIMYLTPTVKTETL